MTREEYKKEIFNEYSSTKVYKSAKKYIKSLEAQIKAKDKRIEELEAMETKKCSGCKQSWEPNNQTFHRYFCNYLQKPIHGNFCCNRYEPKDNK